jgi:glycosyltransferase involved in cell wall biosynthesis
MIKNTVSIIVTTFNRIKYLKTFIKFLYKSTKYPFKLIVVDNGSIDGSRDFILEVEKTGLVWKHVFNNKNLPLAMAFSEGLKLVDTEFVITVADDMIINPELKHDWLEIFVDKMGQDKSIGCINFVGARCIYDKFIKRYDE